jgi:hypothetical protein
MIMMLRLCVVAFMMFAVGSAVAHAESIRLSLQLHSTDEPFALQALAPLPSLQGDAPYQKGTATGSLHESDSVMVLKKK